VSRSHTRKRKAETRRRRNAFLDHLGSDPKRGKGKRRRNAKRKEQIDRTVEVLMKGDKR
jgi:hypothetical protein